MGIKRFLSCVLMALVFAGMDVPLFSQGNEPGIPFSGAPLFSFLSWEKKPQLMEGALSIKVENGKGGCGYLYQRDLSSFADRTPALTLTIGPTNKAKSIRVVLQDEDGTEQSYMIPLDKASPGSTVTIPASEGASVREPAAHGQAGKKEGFDITKVQHVVLVGDWGDSPYDLLIRKFDLVEAGTDIMSAREKMRKRKANEIEDRKKAEDAKVRRINDLISKGAPHPADGPEVRLVCAITPSMMELEIQAQEYKPGSMKPYTAQPDDTLKEGKKEWVVRDGKMVQETVGQTVERKDNKGRNVSLGTLSFDRKWILVSGEVSGSPLDTSVVEEAGAYIIKSTDDKSYASPAVPVAVYRKSKPNSPLANGSMAICHKIYLKLPKPMKEGATYTVQLKGLNTKAESVTYKHDTRSARSEAIHVTQVGYRSDDPFKCGYLSDWLGTGGACDYRIDEVRTFELIDAKSGKTVFTGKPELAKVNEALHAMQKSNYAMTPVYWLDFSSFSTPGTYRVRVPGIGTSYPFPISDMVWDNVFKIGMRGVLCQRTGIELGPPFLEFRRECPGKGAKFYQTEINIRDGQEEARGEALLKLWHRNGKLDEVNGLWGGYQDAGDWDTYTTTLETAGILLEAFEINGDYAKTVKLSLPSAEIQGKIPNLLSEALWGLAAFKRLQLPSGAVRDGYGDGWGARPCDVSWNDSNPLCVYAPSAETSWLYSTVAARMSRALEPYDAAQAAEYKESAIKAWNWAEKQPAEKTLPTDANRKDPKWLAAHAKEAAAAVALFRLTRNQSYHERFKQVCEILEDCKTSYNGGGIEPMKQDEATFLYACLPDDLAEPKLKKNALNRYVLAGNIAVFWMKNNAFNLATAFPGMPMREFCAYFTAPGMGLDIVRAHFLVRDPRFLAAIVASTGFELGANGENLVFTTGVGENPIHFPMKIDYLATGQPAPAGITVYGPSDQSSGSYSEWVHTWFLNSTRMVPDRTKWPPPESYADIFVWPGANEYCVNFPMGMVPYVWCYLAARP